MTNFNISIVSDTVCPWCYLGHRNLLAAQKLWQQQHPADTFNVRFKPYELAPDAPRGTSQPKEAYLRARFGDARVAMMQDRIRGLGRAVGINFTWAGNTGNSHDSHRLISLAQRLGDDVGKKTVDGLFAAYHENGQDITDVNTLRDIAKNAGIPEQEFQKTIAEGNGESAEVEKEVAEARYQGISGVPNFTIQNRYEIGGAQGQEAFLEIFNKIKSSEK